MNIYPTKRNVDALLKVRVIVKVVTFRTLFCVVAKFALATDCCSCWSIHRVRQQLIDNSSMQTKPAKILASLGFWQNRRMKLEFSGIFSMPHERQRGYFPGTASIP